MKNFTLLACSAFPRNSITVLAFICSTQHLLRTSAIMDYHLDTWPFCYFVFIWNPLKDFNKDFFLFHTTAICKKVLFYLNETVSEKKVKSLSHVWLCNSMDCSLPGCSVHGIFQARVLEWVASAFSRRSSWPRGWTQVSHIASRRFTMSRHLFSQECTLPLM